MKSREISRSKIGPFSLACTDPYIGIGWEYQSTSWYPARLFGACISRSAKQNDPIYVLQDNSPIFVEWNTGAWRYYFSLLSRPGPPTIFTESLRFLQNRSSRPRKNRRIITSSPTCQPTKQIFFFWWVCFMVWLRYIDKKPSCQLDLVDIKFC